MVIKKTRFVLFILLAVVLGVVVGGAVTDSIKKENTIFIYEEPPKVIFT